MQCNCVCYCNGSAWITRSQYYSEKHRSARGESTISLNQFADKAGLGPLPTSGSNPSRKRAPTQSEVLDRDSSVPKRARAQTILHSKQVEGSVENDSVEQSTLGNHLLALVCIDYSINYNIS
jgi:hypothetical protein